MISFVISFIVILKFEFGIVEIQNGSEISMEIPNNPTAEISLDIIITPDRRQSIRRPSIDSEFSPKTMRNDIHSRLYSSPTIASSHRTLDKDTDFYIPIDVQPLSRRSDPKFSVTHIPHLVDKGRQHVLSYPASKSTNPATAAAVAKAAYDHNAQFYRPHFGEEDGMHVEPVRDDSRLLKPTLSAVQKQSTKVSPEKSSLHQKAFHAASKTSEVCSRHSG
jgi:hypothetical protein